MTGPPSRRASFGFGVYVHVPFCARRCDYCSFATWTDRGHLMGAYLAALRLEVDRAVEAGMPVATSVFFGGGTPSLVPADDLMAVLDGVPRAPWAEVTVECNPDTVSLDLLRCYRDHGVSRISLGVQSMVPHVLAVARPHARSGQRPSRRRDGGGRRVLVVEPRPHLRRRRGVARRLASARSCDALALEPPHVSRLRTHRRGRHAAGRRPGPPSRRRRPGRQVHRRRLAALGAAGWRATRSPTGPDPTTSATTTSSTGTRATTSASAVPPTRTSRGVGGGTCARRSATSRW